MIFPFTVQPPSLRCWRLYPINEYPFTTRYTYKEIELDNWSSVVRKYMEIFIIGIHIIHINPYIFVTLITHQIKNLFPAWQSADVYLAAVLVSTVPWRCYPSGSLDVFWQRIYLYTVYICKQVYTYIYMFWFTFVYWYIVHI